MSEYNKVQLSFFANGDQVVLRADSGAELLEVAKGVNEVLGDTLKAVNASKQAFLAEGVFTGGGKGNAAPAAAPAASTDGRKADTPPPVSGGAVPNCGCGIPMQDLSAKGYKNRWYASDKCLNKGKDKACWAKK